MPLKNQDMKKTYNHTYYVYADNILKVTCKTKKTAVKYANQFLDSLLYSDVTIDRMTTIITK